VLFEFWFQERNTNLKDTASLF